MIAKQLQCAYKNMMGRCYGKDPKAKYYKGKGIIVCPEWRDHPRVFYKWAIENGYKEGLSLDRKLSSEDYFPENCQWIPLQENREKRNWNWADPVKKVDAAIRLMKHHRPWSDVPIHVWNYYTLPGRKEAMKEQTTKWIRENPEKWKKILKRAHQKHEEKMKKLLA
jgi:hypothetical protein